jgi:putative transcriptional regulator
VSPAAQVRPAAVRGRTRGSPKRCRKASLTFTCRERYLDIVQNRVREQRTQRGLSQAELAAALAVSRQTVISIENGRYMPSLPLAFRIARFFDLPVDKMFIPED